MSDEGRASRAAGGGSPDSTAYVKHGGRRFKIYRRAPAGAEGSPGRDAIWYLRAIVGGRMMHPSLGTNVRKVAEERALRQYILPALAGRWEDVEARNSRRPVARLEEVFAAYVALAPVLNRPRRAFENVVLAAKRVVSVADGVVREDVGELPASVFSEGLVYRFQRAWMARVPAEEVEARNAAAVSANSYVRQARQLFAREVMARAPYAGLVMPELAGFLAARKLREAKRKASLPEPAVLAAVLEAAERLRVDRPGLWLLWWLAVQTGLRKGELRAMRWRWFRPGSVRVCFESDFMPKSREEREVPCAEATEREARSVAVALGWPTGPGDRVIASGFERLARRFGPWLIAAGWTRRQKLHEMRKVYASVLVRSNDVTAVQAALGHQDVRTTQIYAAAPRAGAVDVVAALAVGKETVPSRPLITLRDAPPLRPMAVR